MTLTQFRYGVKPLLFIAMLAPAGWLGVQLLAASQGQPHGLGFNPVEFSHHYTGDWAIRLFLLGLAISPLARFRPLKRLLLMRRQVGLFAAFYAVLHLMSYVGLDLNFDFMALWADIKKRAYITVGITAFLLLLPLVFTSFQRAVRWLGGRRWQALHRLVYAVVGLGLVHFYMMRKGIQLEPLVYILIYLLLMLARLKPVQQWQRRQTTPKSQA